MVEFFRLWTFLLTNSSFSLTNSSLFKEYGRIPIESRRLQILMDVFEFKTGVDGFLRRFFVPKSSLKNHYGDFSFQSHH